MFSSSYLRECSILLFSPALIRQKQVFVKMGQDIRDSSKQLEKTRDIDEYNVADPIVKYDPELVRNSLSKVIFYVVKYYIRTLINQILYERNSLFMIDEYFIFTEI